MLDSFWLGFTGGQTIEKLASYLIRFGINLVFKAKRKKCKFEVCLPIRIQVLVKTFGLLLLCYEILLHVPSHSNMLLLLMRFVGGILTEALEIFHSGKKPE